MEVITRLFFFFIQQTIYTPFFLYIQLHNPRTHVTTTIFSFLIHTPCIFHIIVAILQWNVIEINMLLMSLSCAS